MVALLNPAALLALLGLLVPVAIHLWNRRPGREVAVGSLRWLAAGANRRLRHLKPEQLWLLLLRATLLAVLAVAVAGPVWRTALPTSRGVVLLSAEAAGLPALAGLKPTVDSLRRRGYALRWLAAGFPRVQAAAWREMPAGHSGATFDSVAALAAATPRPPAFAWARVQQAAATFPGQPLLVVTSAALRNFGGSHAPLPAAVHWQALPDTTTTAWLATAEMSSHDSLSLLVGHSDERRTTFERKPVRAQYHGQPMQVAGLAPVRFKPGRNGDDYFLLVPVAEPESENGVPTGQPPMVIELYTSPEFTADARYLEAALRAASTGLALAPVLRRMTVRPRHLTTAGWTFWLSNEPLPAGWREEMQRKGGHLWREAAGPGVADTARLATFGAAVSVFRREVKRGNDPSSRPLWADARGRPVLAYQPVGRGAVYHLSTRLNPAWSELADNPELPAQLLTLLQPELGNSLTPAAMPSDQPLIAQQLALHDQRALDPAQLVVAAGSPAKTTVTDVPAKPAGPPGFRQTDLRPWLVVLAGLLLLFERLLAARRAAAISPASV